MIQMEVSKWEKNFQFWFIQQASTIQNNKGTEKVAQERCLSPTQWSQPVPPLSPHPSQIDPKINSMIGAVLSKIIGTLEVRSRFMWQAHGEVTKFCSQKRGQRSTGKIVRDHKIFQLEWRGLDQSYVFMARSRKLQLRSELLMYDVMILIYRKNEEHYAQII